MRLIIAIVLVMSVTVVAPVAAQIGVEVGGGALVAVERENCDILLVRLQVDENVPYYLRVIDRDSEFLFAQGTGFGIGDRFTQQLVELRFFRAPANLGGESLWVELFLNNERSSPRSALEFTPTCSLPLEPAPVREVAPRIVEDPNLVVFLESNNALVFYEINGNSEGVLVGAIQPGWRNDAAPGGLISRIVRGDGVAAELYHNEGSTYTALLRNANGSERVQRSFTAPARVPNGGAVVTTTVVQQPPPTANQSAPSSSGDNGASARANGTFDGTYYTVAAGDYLYRIALRFNTTVGAIQAANSLANPNRIEVGQRLRIP